MKALGLIIFITLLIILGPLLTIWALNTLFPTLDIPVTFWTWLATLLLGGAIRGGSK